MKATESSCCYGVFAFALNGRNGVKYHKAKERVHEPSIWPDTGCTNRDVNNKELMYKVKCHPCFKV